MVLRFDFVTNHIWPHFMPYREEIRLAPSWYQETLLRRPLLAMVAESDSDLAEDDPLAHRVINLFETERGPFYCEGTKSQTIHRMDRPDCAGMVEEIAAALAVRSPIRRLPRDEWVELALADGARLCSHCFGTSPDGW